MQNRTYAIKFGSTALFFVLLAAPPAWASPPLAPQIELENKTTLKVRIINPNADTAVYWWGGCLVQLQKMTKAGWKNVRGAPSFCPACVMRERPELTPIKPNEILEMEWDGRSTWCDENSQEQFESLRGTIRFELFYSNSQHAPSSGNQLDGAKSVHSEPVLLK